MGGVRFGRMAGPQRGAIRHILTGADKMVPGEGFEPPTFGLQNRCTTTVLTRRHAKFPANTRRAVRSPLT